MTNQTTFTVLGAGSWGTALALQLSYAGCAVKLWTHEQDHALAMKTDGENTKFLPGITFPENLKVYPDLAEAIAGNDYILLATPSHAFVDMVKVIRENHDGQGLVVATKGFADQNKLLHVVAEKYLADVPYAVLSGPSFAKEVAKQLPTTVIIASKDEAFAKQLADCFSHQRFRVYTHNDVTGVEVGGAVKNVLAVAVGISDGMGFGANAKSALITRGLNEMIRLGEVLGGKQKTMMGLSGLGDLILTCTDDQSRNRRFGLAVGAGKSVAEALDSIGQVVESVPTVNQVYQLAKQHNIEMPITEQVYLLLQNKISAQDAVKALFARSLKAE